MPERVYRENEMIGIRKGPNVGKLEQQNFGTLEHSNIGISDSWNGKWE
jgi:hypothetical protein